MFYEGLRLWGVQFHKFYEGLRLWDARFVVFYEGLGLWEAHLYVFYESGRLSGGLGVKRRLTLLWVRVGPLKKDPHVRGWEDHMSSNDVGS